MSQSAIPRVLYVVDAIAPPHHIKNALGSKNSNLSLNYDEPKWTMLTARSQTFSQIKKLVRERTRQLQALIMDQKVLLVNGHKEKNIRIPAKSQQRVIAIFHPISIYA